MTATCSAYVARLLPWHNSFRKDPEHLHRVMQLHPYEAPKHVSLRFVCHNRLNDWCMALCNFCKTVLGSHHSLLFVNRESCGILEV